MLNMLNDVKLFAAYSLLAIYSVMTTRDQQSSDFLVRNTTFQNTQDGPNSEATNSWP